MSITLASDPEAEFKALTHLMKESGNEEDNANGDDDEDEDGLE
jgi:hypothetical protein